MLRYRLRVHIGHLNMYSRLKVATSSMLHIRGMPRRLVRAKSSQVRLACSLCLGSFASEGPLTIKYGVAVALLSLDHPLARDESHTLFGSSLTPLLTAPFQTIPFSAIACRASTTTRSIRDMHINVWIRDQARNIIYHIHFWTIANHVYRYGGSTRRAQCISAPRLRQLPTYPPT